MLGDIESLREIWRDAALCVAPDDSCALYGALMSLIADDARRGDLAIGARSRADRYTSARMADAYAAVYAELLRSPVPQHAEPAVN